MDWSLFQHKSQTGKKKQKNPIKHRNPTPGAGIGIDSVFSKLRDKVDKVANFVVSLKTHEITALPSISHNGDMVSPYPEKEVMRSLSLDLDVKEQTGGDPGRHKSYIFKKTHNTQSLNIKDEGDFFLWKKEP